MKIHVQHAKAIIITLCAGNLTFINMRQAIGAAIDFYTSKLSVFIVEDGRSFKQMRGLAMGGKLSFIICALSTS